MSPWAVGTLTRIFRMFYRQNDQSKKKLLVAVLQYSHTTFLQTILTVNKTTTGYSLYLFYYTTRSTVSATTPLCQLSCLFFLSSCLLFYILCFRWPQCLSAPGSWSWRGRWPTCSSGSGRPSRRRTLRLCPSNRSAASRPRHCLRRKRFVERESAS